MDVYRLDHEYNRIGVIDEYDSFIWTERFSAAGDFKMKIRPTSKLISLLPTGSIIAQSETDRLMVVEKFHKETSQVGEVSIVISGRSVESFLDRRVIGPNRDGPDLTVTGTPAWVARRLVEKICVNGEDIYELDRIPNLGVSSTPPQGSEIDFALKPGSLYTTIKELCDSDNFGFNIRLRDESPRLIFRCTYGVERPNVVFSSDFDNLAEESYLKDVAEYKNVAYVWTKDNRSRLTVYGKGVLPTISALNRRILHVSANDLDYAEYAPNNIPKLQRLMRQRGLEALGEHSITQLFDGKLTSVNPFNYGANYYLGDIVTLVGPDGEHQKSIVSEYMWAHDNEGLRSYPTFVAKE